MVILSSNKPWPLSLTRKEKGGISPYTPRSDFNIVVAGIPVLIIEVNSDAGKMDRRRMLLQGSCLVRLGNSLRKTESPPFIIKAIYIDEHYRAFEYTMYQLESEVSDCSAYCQMIRH